MDTFTIEPMQLALCIEYHDADELTAATSPFGDEQRAKQAQAWGIAFGVRAMTGIDIDGAPKPYRPYDLR